jgi:mRNA deadenylase 3'-5' endonuclease subunit Ccr4
MIWQHCQLIFSEYEPLSQTNNYSLENNYDQLGFHNYLGVWGDFLSYSWFYEVTILESTYVTNEKKM